MSNRTAGILALAIMAALAGCRAILGVEEAEYKPDAGSTAGCGGQAGASSEGGVGGMAGDASVDDGAGEAGAAGQGGNADAGDAAESE